MWILFFSSSSFFIERGSASGQAILTRVICIYDPYKVNRLVFIERTLVIDQRVKWEVRAKALESKWWKKWMKRSSRASQNPTEPSILRNFKKKNERKKERKKWEGVDKTESAHLAISGIFFVRRSGKTHNRIPWLLSRYFIRLELTFSTNSAPQIGEIEENSFETRAIAVVIILSRQWINKHSRLGQRWRRAAVS